MDGQSKINKDLLNQRWAMLTNPHAGQLDTIRLLDADLEAHEKDLKALDWSDMTHKPLKMPIPTREIILQCWARFYKEFFQN